MGKKALDWMKGFAGLLRPERTDQAHEPEDIPESDLALPGMLEKKVSPLNEPVWRLIVLILAGSFLTWLFRVVFGSGSAAALWIVALTALGTWAIAIRMLLMVTKLRKFWIVFLGTGFVFLILTVVVPGFVYAAGSFAGVFLLFRKYKPYRYLTSKRRAVLFMLGILAFILLFPKPPI